MSPHMQSSESLQVNGVQFDSVLCLILN